MDKQPMSIDLVKQGVRALIGRNIIVKVNKSRNKFVEYEAFVDKTYPFIFTIVTQIDNQPKTLSYKYSDVLTKTVTFIKKP